MIGLMKNQFCEEDRMKSFEDKTLLRDQAEKDKRTQENIDKRDMQRKEKEMMTKLYQDQQVMEKMNKRATLDIEKQ